MDAIVNLLVSRYGFSRSSAELYAQQIMTSQRDFLAGGPDPNVPAYQTMRDTPLGKKLRGEAATMAAEQQASMPSTITHDAWRAFADAMLNGKEKVYYEKPAMVESVTNKARIDSHVQARANERYAESGK